MKTTKLIVSISLQGYVEVDVPSEEEVRMGAQPECRIDATKARTSHLLGFVSGDAVATEEATFAGQLALNSIAVAYAEQVARGTQTAMDARRGAGVTFSMPQGQA